MYTQLIQKLSAYDIHALGAKGVPASRVSEWRRGSRIPTRSQAFALATVTGIPFDKLERELAEIELTKDAEKNPGLASLLDSITSLKRYVAHFPRFSARQIVSRMHCMDTPNISANCLC